MTDVLPVGTVIASLSRVDIAIVAIAILVLFVISYVFGREEKDTNDFFLGG